MNRREFIKTSGITVTSMVISAGSLFSEGKQKERPNIIFILADDLGYGELGCYGQEQIKTPNIDRLAADGMKFTQHYSGSPVCAPSRCTLMTGKHTGHAYIRANDEMNERGDVWHDRNIEGQRPLLPNTETIGVMLQRAGYVTGAIGKWGLGGPYDSGHPNKQGFDFWYGYLCQRVAHNYYPTHLWRNAEKDTLEGNDYFYPHQKLPEDKDPNDPASYTPYSGKHYSMDLMATEALNFIKQHKDRSFFLYLPFTVPHASIQVPDDALEEYKGKFHETPYKGEKSYLPNQTPRAAYAAMITRMDREIGRILNFLKELGLDEKTLVIFTSDNGTAGGYGGTDPEFFNSSGGLRDFKGSLYEGGIRVPMIARWKGKIKSGTVSHHISAFWDFYPTFAEMVKAKAPDDVDGISLLPTLLGRRQEMHDYLYWEYLGKQAIRMSRWKAVKPGIDKKIELYDLENDVGEKNNITDQHPEIVAEIAELMKIARTVSELFPLNQRK